MNGARITETDLHAYVDGELEPGRRAEVDRYLAEHPLDADRVRDWHRANESLGALYAHIVEEPVPTRLDVHRLAGALAASRSSHSWRGVAVAAVLSVTIGLASGWIGRGYWTGPDLGQSKLVDEAVAAHNLYAREVVHPVEVRADQHVHLAAWLSRRLDRSFVVPDLRPLGFSLVGGRLLPVQGQPAAQLMYEDETGQRVTFMIVAENEGQETSLQYAQVDGFSSFLWIDETLRCVLVGSLDRDRLRNIATRVYDQLG
jgi:anti-sigma factor RsiW